MTEALPNVLTAVRLVAVPALVWMILFGEGDGRSWGALVLFLFASATDFLDGFLARRWGVVTAFGKIADPIADKALVLGTLGVLVVVGIVPWWPLAVLALREVAITIGRLVVARRRVIAAGRGGKLKTALQVAAITFYLVPSAPAWLETTAWWILLAAVVVAVASGASYARRIVQAMRAPSDVPESEHAERA